jgi:WD40 repeat protein
MSTLKIIFTLLSFISTLSYGQIVEVITQERSKGVINQLVYNPDGTLIASTSENDPVVKVWDIKTGKIIGKLEDHDEEVISVAFSPKGTKMVSASKDGKVIYWDIINWKLIDSVSFKDEKVTNIVFDGENTFYSGNDNGQIKKWDVKKISNPTDVFKCDNHINKMDLYDNKLVAGTTQGKVYSIDLLNNTELLSKKIHLGKIIGLKIFDNGKKIVTAGADGIVHFWNINNLIESKHIKASAGTISAFDANEKKDMVTIANKNKAIKVYSFSGNLLYDFKAKTDDTSHPIKALALSPDGSTISSANFRIIPTIKRKIKESFIQVWDLKRGTLYKTLKGEVNSIYSFDFHPEQNRLITLGENRTLTFWDFETAEKYGDFTLIKPKREIPPNKNKNFKTGKNLLKMASDISKGKIPTNTGAKDVGASLLKRVFKEKPIVKYSSKGNYLITKLKGDELRLYSLKDRKPEYVKPLFSYQTNINDFTTSPDEKYLIVIGSGNDAISIVDIETGDFIKKLNTPAPAGNLKYLYEATSIAFSPDGNHLAVCFNTGKVFVFRTSSWYLEFENTLIGDLGYVKGAFVNFSNDGNYIIINTMSGVAKYNIKDYSVFDGGLLKTKGVSIPIDKPSDYAVTVKDNFLFFENVLTGKITKSIRVNPKNISRVSVKKDGKMGVTLISGQFLLLNPETGEDEILLVSNGDNYIFKTHENYYKVSKEGTDLVTFRIGNQAFPFEQFDAVFNRPDLVLKKLNSQDSELIELYKRAYDKRIQKLGLKPTTNISLDNIPECKVTNLVDIPAVTEENSITVSYSFKDSKGLQSYNIWINNVPLDGKKGKSIVGKTTYTNSTAIDLVYGINKIQVSCRNEDGYESLIETFYVTKEGEMPKPSLYLVTIGTSKYKTGKFDLGYPVKDAKDLTNIMTANDKGVYAEVKTKSLFDSDVTIENVLDLKSFLNEASPNDVVIVFIAGHGVLDANFDYYFATYDMDFNNPKGRGLPYEDLESIIDGIKAKRKILIMDTCHSGEIDKEEAFFSEEDEQEEDEDIDFRSAGPNVGTNETNASPSKVMNELFNDLRKGTGATVISSAGGAEYAMESDEWKNGLFTYCLLMGIKNGKADLNQDGAINLIELQTYVTEKVKALSHGKQIPNSRIQNLELDFRIW